MPRPPQRAQEGDEQTSASQQLEARGGALEAKREGTKGTKRREETGAGRRIEEAAAVSDEAKRNNHQRILGTKEQTQLGSGQSVN